jgi:nitroreductase
MEYLEWRYAVKKFDAQRMLTDEQIEKIKHAFNLTASSYGLQPIKMVVVKNKDLQQKLVSFSMDQQQVAQASHVLVICIENSVDQKYIADYFKRVVAVRGTPEEILNPFKENLTSSFSDKSEAEIQEWSKNQAYLAMGNLLAYCALEKIDSCPMEGFEPDAYDKILGLTEKGLTSVLVMPVGHRAEDDVFSTFKKVRKSMEKSIIEIN